jgi:hypothetical protein
LLCLQKKKRKEEAYPWKAGVSSGHITNLKQSILETFDIYELVLVMAAATKKEKKKLILGRPALVRGT